MATYLPGSGAISINDINTLFGRGNNLNAYRGTQYYTSSAGPFTFSSGAIAMNNFYGTGPQANSFSFTISANQTNADLRTLAVNAGWGGSSPVIATISGGVVISSNSTGTPALTVSGSFPGGVQLINNGAIIGMGGNGGKGADINGNGTVAGGAGSSGGGALSVSTAITITNNGTIGGGGGGGGGSTIQSVNVGKFNYKYCGSGGGGGRSSAAANSSGGGAGSKLNFADVYNGTTGGTGTYSGAGSGGVVANGVPGGNGGGWGSSGAAGTAGNWTDPRYPPGGGGGAGYAVVGNGYISWAATGTRLGGIS